MKICPQCRTSLPDDARYCLQCGTLQTGYPDTDVTPTPTWDWQGDLVNQAFVTLGERLAERVAAEQAADRLHLYQERLYQRGYRETVQRRLEQWRESLTVPADEADRQTRLRELRELTDDLLDFFFVRHTADLNRVVLPEAALRYQWLPAEEIDRNEMALTYLDFANEEERVYTEFITLSARKIRNAGKAFLFPERDEKIWFICDQSLLGNAKSGFAMTEKALYWKTGLQAPQRVYYHKLFALQREKEWLLINELYFNASPSLNTKMIWLLRRLGRMMSDG